MDFDFMSSRRDPGGGRRGPAPYDYPRGAEPPGYRGVPVGAGEPDLPPVPPNPDMDRGFRGRPNVGLPPTQSGSGQYGLPQTSYAASYQTGAMNGPQHQSYGSAAELPQQSYGSMGDRSNQLSERRYGTGAELPQHQSYGSAPSSIKTGDWQSPGTFGRNPSRQRRSTGSDYNSGSSWS